MANRVPFGGGTLLCPVPAVLITCGKDDRVNVMTAAWTGVVNSKPPRVYVSIRPERYSHALIVETGELVINLTTADMVRAVDFCGVRSGRDVDKFKECGLKTQPSTVVSAPTLSDCPLALECRVFERRTLGCHDVFLLDVVGVTVRDDLLTPEGKLALGKTQLLAYAHGEYRALEHRLLGTFGFSVMKKRTAKRKAAEKKSERPQPKSAAGRGEKAKKK